jgi:hypothetical protein
MMLTRCAVCLFAVQALSRRFIKMNSMRVYKQDRFNLANEESQGFSKVTEIVTESCLEWDCP